MPVMRHLRHNGTDSRTPAASQGRRKDPRCRGSRDSSLQRVRVQSRANRPTSFFEIEPGEYNSRRHSILLRMLIVWVSVRTDGGGLPWPGRPVVEALAMHRCGSPPNKALQRTRLSYGCFPWRSVRAAELGRFRRFGSTALSRCRE